MRYRQVRKLSEQEIMAMAPNITAVNNAKKISKNGSFIKLEKSEDETFYMGICSGSGKSNYTTSIDFIKPEEPVFRCSCPSRQFPCKHSIALMFETITKEFSICEIPEDILTKRAKKEARIEKKEEKKKGPVKVNKAARTKKMKKQLEGLQLTNQVIEELLQAGLGTLSGNSVKVYKDLAKQLGDYYLSGPQLYIKQLILEIEQLQQDSDSSHYEKAISILVKLHTVVKKSSVYLEEKLKSEELGEEDTILYEELGGIWKLEQLQQLGLKKENARLLQLSFWVYLDKARQEYVDIAYWADIETAEIFTTYNYRPIKALKYVKEEDSIFQVVHIPMLTYYPGNFNRRIRWEGATYVDATKEDFMQLKANAYQELKILSKAVKNEIKNVLTEDYMMVLLNFSKIGMTSSGYVVIDKNEDSILLEDREGVDGTISRLVLLPDKSLLENQTLLGAVSYNAKNKKLCMQPYSIITEEKVIRLFY